jgi:hypothetical protein
MLHYKIARAIPGKVRSGFPSGIAQKQILGAVQRFREALNRSRVAKERIASST